MKNIITILEEFVASKITDLDVVTFRPVRSGFVNRTDVYLNKVKAGTIDMEDTEEEYPEIYQLHKNELGKSITIQYVSILPKFQGKGLLKPTLEYIEKDYIEKGYDSIFLKVETVSDTPSELLIKMYSKYGFQHFVTGTETLIEDYYMVKYI